MFAGNRNVLFICAITLGFTALSWSLSAAPALSQAGTAVGPKNSISVGAFESPETLGGAATAAGLTAMLTDALVKDGRFVVVERTALTAVQGEQQLGTQGATTANTAAKTGQLLGARVLVVGTVTKFNPAASGGSLNVGGASHLFGGLANSLGVSDTTAEAEIAIRMIDTTTGQIIYAGTTTGTASTSGFNAQVTTNRGGSLGGTTLQGTPLGEAAQQAINDAVAQIALAMAKVQ